MENTEKTLKLVKEAYKFINDRKYSHAFAILDEMTASINYDPYPLFLLAVACIYSDKFNRANEIMEILGEKFPDYIPFVHLQAFLKLKSAGGPEEVRDNYISYIGKHPFDPFLQRIEKKIRNIKNFEKFQKSAKLYDFVHIPKPPKDLKDRLSGKAKIGDHTDREVKKAVKKFKYANLIYSIIVIGLAAVILMTSDIMYRVVGLKNKNARYFKEIDMINLGGSSFDAVKKINRNTTPEFYANFQDLVRDFRKSKRLIKSGRLNDAVLLLNRIYNSNAGYSIKEKVDFLIKFVTEFDDRKFENIPYREILKKPYLYRGYSLKWKGKITNLKTGSRKTLFTMLVDYKNNDVFTGVAEVFAGTENKELNNGDIVEVKGIFTETIGSEKRMYVFAKMIEKVMP